MLAGALTVHGGQTAQHNSVLNLSVNQGPAGRNSLANRSNRNGWQRECADAEQSPLEVVTNYLIHFSRFF